MVAMIKTYFRRFKDIILVLAVLGTLGTSYALKQVNNDRKRLNLNLTAKQDYITEINGKYVNQSNAYHATVGELKRAKAKAKVDSSLLSEYEKKVLKAESKAKYLGLKVEDLEATVMTLLEATKDTTMSIDTAYADSLNDIKVKLQPMITEHWSVELDTLHIDASDLGNIKVNNPNMKAVHISELDIFIDRYRARKDGTRIEFLPKWYFWKPYIKESTVTSSDPDEIIKSNVIILWE